MKTIYFDLDGTLLDHFNVIHRCIVYAQYQLGFPDSSLQQVKAAVGGSLPVTLSRLIGEDFVAEAMGYYNECYEKMWHQDIKLLPGVRWLLPSLRHQGHRLAVFTNKSTTDSFQLLSYIYLDKFFDAIIGTSADSGRKPEKAFTEAALDKLKVDPEHDEVLFIGDSPFDVEAGKACEIPCYCVTTGSHTRDALTGARPAGIYKDLFELGEKLFELKKPEAPRSQLKSAVA